MANHAVHPLGAEGQAHEQLWTTLCCMLQPHDFTNYGAPQVVTPKLEFVHNCRSRRISKSSSGRRTCQAAHASMRGEATSRPNRSSPERHNSRMKFGLFRVCLEMPDPGIVHEFVNNHGFNARNLIMQWDARVGQNGSPNLAEDSFSKSGSTLQDSCHHSVRTSNDIVAICLAILPRSQPQPTQQRHLSMWGLTRLQTLLLPSGSTALAHPAVTAVLPIHSQRTETACQLAAHRARDPAG